MLPIQTYNPLNDSIYHLSDRIPPPLLVPILIFHNSSSCLYNNHEHLIATLISLLEANLRGSFIDAAKGKIISKFKAAHLVCYV